MKHVGNLPEDIFNALHKYYKDIGDPSKIEIKIVANGQEFTLPTFLDKNIKTF